MNPLEHMPEVSRDLGNKLWAKVGEGLDAMMNAIIEGAGNLLGAVVTKGPGMLADMTSKVGAAVSLPSGSDPMDHKHMRPDNSPQVAEGQRIEAPSRGLGREAASDNLVGQQSAPKTISLPSKAFEAVEALRANAQMAFAYNVPSESQVLGTGAQHGISFNGVGAARGAAMGV